MYYNIILNPSTPPLYHPNIVTASPLPPGKIAVARVPSGHLPSESLVSPLFALFHHWTQISTSFVRLPPGCSCPQSCFNNAVTTPPNNAIQQHHPTTPSNNAVHQRHLSTLFGGAGQPLFNNAIQRRHSTTPFNNAIQQRPSTTLFNNAVQQYRATSDHVRRLILRVIKRASSWASTLPWKSLKRYSYEGVGPFWHSDNRYYQTILRWNHLGDCGTWRGDSSGSRAFLAPRYSSLPDNPAVKPSRRLWNVAW